MRTAFFLYAFGVMGLMLLTLPWTAAWSQAVYALISHTSDSWLLSGWLRGGVSGLGALDLMIAFQMAVELWRSTRRPAAPRSMLDRD